MQYRRSCGAASHSGYWSAIAPIPDSGAHDDDPPKAKPRRAGRGSKAHAARAGRIRVYRRCEARADLGGETLRNRRVQRGDQFGRRWRLTTNTHQAAVVRDLPRNAAEVAQRLQKRLSAFALAVDTVCRDADRLQELALQMHAGIHVNQRELAEIALRMFDAREVLG